MNGEVTYEYMGGRPGHGEYPLSGESGNWAVVGPFSMGLDVELGCDFQEGFEVEIMGQYGGRVFKEEGVLLASLIKLLTLLTIIY